jgi:hypothetical protein
MSIQQLCEVSAHELDEMERRAEAAHQGPWISYVVGRDREACSNFIEFGCCNELGSFDFVELNGATDADQDFIAAARQDLPRLVNEVRMLRARLRCLEAMHTHDEITDPRVFVVPTALEPRNAL